MESTGDVDLNWLKDNMKAKGYNVSVLESYDLKPAVAEGENYVSQVYRLTIQTLSNQGQPGEVSLILKRKLDVDYDNENIKEKLNLAFNIEHQVYDNILSRFKRYMGEGLELWPQYIGSIPDQDIYFEDLSVSGYKLASRHDGMDFDHCLLVFKNLARFHAASCIAVEERVVDLSEYKQYIMLGTATVEYRPKTSEFEMMTDVILNDWGSEWKELAQRLNNHKDTIENEAFELGVFDESRFNVFCHGDTWVNNIMFKYDNNGKPESLKFIDFQISTYNCFGFDICYFLSTSINPDTREKHLDTLINAYCSTFSDCIDNNASSHPKPTLELVRSEITRLAAFRLLISMRIRPIIMAPPEHRVNLQDMLTNPQADFKKRRIYANPKYVKVMKSDLPYILYDMESVKNKK